MSRKPSPCKDCQERHHGCHSECEKYKAMVEHGDMIKKAKSEAYELNRPINTPYERKIRQRRY